MKKPLINSLLLATLLAMPALAHTAHASTLSAENSTDGIIAKVNDEVILKSELIAAMTSLDAQYRQNGTQLSSARLQNIALDALIMRKLQIGLIKRANATPNESVLNNQMLQIARSQGLNSLAELQSTLDARQAGSYAALRNQLIEEASLQALQQHQVQSRVNISEQEVDAFLASADGKALNQTQYHTIHVRVPYVDDFSRLSNTQKQAAEDTALRVKAELESGKTLQAAMESARGNYPQEIQGADTGYNPAAALPTELASVITRLNKGEVSSPIATASGVDIIMLADTRTDDAVLIPEWQTSHILVGVNNSQTDAIARQKIDDLYRQLQQGASFADLAATYSEDTGSATQRGSLGWVNEGVMVPEFEAVMKNTEKGDYSTPFRSQFGWHILKIDDARTRDVTNQYRRNMAREALFNRLAPQAQEDWLQELRASAYIEIVE